MPEKTIDNWWCTLARKHNHFRLFDIQRESSTVAVLRGGLGSLESPPWYYAWMTQNFINVLIFRVRPHVCLSERHDEETEEYT